MKTFEHCKLKFEHINRYGEKMTLVLAKDMTMWLHHSDINEDFENMRAIFTKNCDYIFNQEEQAVITNFNELAIKIIKLTK